MISHLSKPWSSASLTHADRIVMASMTRKNTIGSVGLEGGDVSGAVQGGQDAAESAALDAIEHRPSRDEFDRVAVGRALLVEPERALTIREGRTGERVSFDRTGVATLA